LGQQHDCSDKAQQSHASITEAMVALKGQWRFLLFLPRTSDQDFHSKFA
jgi:hypothetical protein